MLWPSRVGSGTGLWAAPAVAELAGKRASHGRRETMNLEISTCSDENRIALLSAFSSFQHSFALAGVGRVIGIGRDDLLACTALAPQSLSPGDAPSACNCGRSVASFVRASMRAGKVIRRRIGVLRDGTCHSGGGCLMGRQSERVRPLFIRVMWTELTQRFLLCNNNKPGGKCN